MNSGRIYFPSGITCRSGGRKRNLSSRVGGSGRPSLAARGEGHEVMAAQYGIDTPEGDVATVRRILGRVSSPAILVGHSYGGSVITATGTATGSSDSSTLPRSPSDAGETSQSQQEKFPVTDVFKYVELGERRLWLSRKASRASPGTSRSTSKNLCGRPTMHRLPTSSAGVHLEVEAELVHRGEE